MKGFIDFLAQNRAHPGQRGDTVGSLARIGKELPPHSKLLVHDLLNGALGAHSQIVNDAVGWQGGNCYSRLSSPRAAGELWKRLGVTHTAYYPDRDTLNLDQLAGELVYRRAALAYARTLGTMDGRRYAEIGAASRADGFVDEPTRVAWLDCNHDLATAIYTARGLVERRPEAPLDPTALASAPRVALESANAIAAMDGCAEASFPDAEPEFERAGRAGVLTLWVRERRGARPAP